MARVKRDARYWRKEWRLQLERTKGERLIASNHSQNYVRLKTDCDELAREFRGLQDAMRDLTGANQQQAKRIAHWRGRCEQLWKMHARFSALLSERDAANNASVEKTNELNRLHNEMRGLANAPEE